MAIDRNKILLRISERMMKSADKYRCIGRPIVYEWSELIKALASLTDEMLIDNRDKFEEFINENELRG